MISTILILSTFWTKGIIILLHNKGDKPDMQNNIRKTLLRNFSKLFTILIDRRINAWCDENNVILDSRFGFRSDWSTTEAGFVTHSFVNKKI